MGKKRSLRDLLIVFIAILGAIILVFNAVFISIGFSKTFIILTGVIILLIALIISLSRIWLN